MQRRRRLVVVVALVAAGVGAGIAPGASAGGLNDPACRPDAAHPRPVVMLHGLGGDERNMSYLAPLVRDAGFCAYTLHYGVDPRTRLLPYQPGGVIRIESSAAELQRFVEQVLARTGAAQVDIVGHSEGTIMPRYYLERLGGAPQVKRFVALTPLWRGTEFLGAALLRDLLVPYGLSGQGVGLVASFCAACPQALRGSDFLADLNADGEAIAGIEHTNILTATDELVTPYTSGIMRDGGTNITLQDVCPTHLHEHIAVAFDPAVGQLILNALDPASAKPIPC